MSKRRKTPDLPSMDDLLDSRTSTDKPKSKQTPKSRDSQESERRTKVTYYLPGDLVDRIDEAHFKLNKLTRGTDLKIHKYDMARIAWELALDEFEQLGEDSPLAAHLLSD